MGKSINIGLICIFLISVLIGMTALIKGGDKAFEVALASLNGASLIGGWLGHVAYTEKLDNSTNKKEG